MLVMIIVKSCCLVKSLLNSRDKPFYLAKNGDKLQSNYCVYSKRQIWA